MEAGARMSRARVLLLGMALCLVGAVFVEVYQPDPHRFDSDEDGVRYEA